MQEEIVNAMMDDSDIGHSPVKADVKEAKIDTGVAKSVVTFPSTSTDVITLSCGSRTSVSSETSTSTKLTSLTEYEDLVKKEDLEEAENSIIR